MDQISMDYIPSRNFFALVEYLVETCGGQDRKSARTEAFQGSYGTLAGYWCPLDIVGKKFVGSSGGDVFNSTVLQQ